MTEPAAPPDTGRARVELIALCLAPPGHLSAERGRFLDLLDTLGHEAVFGMALRGHFIGPLARALAGVAPDHPILTLAEPFQRYQAVFADLLMAELGRLSGATRALGHRLIVLKGPGHWGRIYDAPWMRLARDLDLLVAGQGGLAALAAALPGLGYAADTAAVAEALAGSDHYELPEFVRRTRVALPDEARASLHDCARAAPFHLLLEPRGDAAYEVTLLVELHKAPFVYRDGSQPEVTADWIEPHALIPHCAVLKPEYQLPYLAVKFAQDCEIFAGGVEWMRKTPLKLIGDIVGILRRADQAQVARSIAVAERLGAVEPYVQTLHAVQRLAPDLALKNLPAPRCAIPIEEIFDAI